MQIVPTQNEKDNYHQQAYIGANQRHNSDIAPISVRTSKTTNYGHEIEIKGESRLIYDPNQARCNGATCWIETEAAVLLIERNGDRLPTKIEIN